TSEVRFSLTGLTGDANLGLLNAQGQWVTWSWNGGTANESIVRTLAAGTYYLGVYSNSTSAHYTLSVVQTDWFDQNLRDEGLRTTTRQLALDGILCRNDMINIFRNAKDGNVIDANELNDLRAIVNHAARFNMPDYVKVLANKVVYTDTANAWWTGGEQQRTNLGNLFAGASADHMEKLIGKWFLGLDRPSLLSEHFNDVSYQYVRGSLFKNGISAEDIVQGEVGDCYFLATLASIAHEQPSRIESMFIDNGDDTFTVRFFNNGKADYVTVDRYLPTRNSLWSSGKAVYAGWGGGRYDSSDNELWVALAEKAYAQLVESGWSRSRHTSSPQNSYSGIHGGWSDYVIRQTTNLSAQQARATDISGSALINWVNNSDRIVTVAFVDGGGYGVINLHGYAIKSYNSATQKFFLYNPHGENHVELTFAQLQSLNGRIVYSV
ncbi:MAG: C2 family cysteine protease, partial [Gloeomargarita sp. DG_1_6_bins_138]